MARKYLRRQVDLDAIKEKKAKLRKKKLLIFGALVFIFLGLGAFIFSRFDTIRAVFNPVSFVSRLINPVELKQVDGRVNVLVLGLDTRGGRGLMNTDTILVGSFSPAEGKPVLISIPRDFWVNLNPYGYGRINAAYSRGGTLPDGSFDETKGVSFARDKVEEILGIEIPYYAVVDFEGFEQIINTLGGIEVCVDQAFDDFSYPVSGNESAPLSQRYEHLHFDAGCQNMKGETALKFARSRMGTNGEGSDFARVRRQQKVILGVKDKLISSNLLLDPPKLAKLYGQVSQTVKTNVTLGEAQRGLKIAQEFEDLSKVESLVLDPESDLVYVPQNRAPYGGAYVLVPQDGNFEKIHKRMRELLFGSGDKKEE